jgi:hypothetical protein
VDETAFRRGKKFLEATQLTVQLGNMRHTQSTSRQIRSTSTCQPLQIIPIQRIKNKFQLHNPGNAHFGVGFKTEQVR